MEGLRKAGAVRSMLYGAVPLLIVPVVLVASSGCGYIADKDRIVVATLNGEPIRRGDLAEVIRKMPDEVRPLIQNKGDLLRTLNKYIDDQIKAELSKELKAEGKIQVDRNLARDRYFEKHPEFRSVYQIRDPAAIQMTEGDIAALKAEIEFGVDEEEEILLREEALHYKIQEAVQAGAVSVTEEEFKGAYTMLKGALVKPEFVEFIAIQFPVAAPGAVEEAGRALRRLDQGEPFDDVLATYLKLNPAMGMRSALENNPASAKYRQFWEVVSGCEVGQRFGPVFMPVREQFGVAEDGTTQLQSVPPVYLVLEVIEHSPARTMTVDEARPAITTSLLKSKVTQLLRAEHGVEIYPDKLPRPEGYGDQYKDQMIKTSV